LGCTRGRCGGACIACGITVLNSQTNGWPCLLRPCSPAECHHLPASCLSSRAPPLPCSGYTPMAEEVSWWHAVGERLQDGWLQPSISHYCLLRTLQPLLPLPPSCSRRWTRPGRGGAIRTRAFTTVATSRGAARRPSCRCTAPTNGLTRWGPGAGCQLLGLAGGQELAPAGAVPILPPSLLTVPPACTLHPIPLHVCSCTCSAGAGAGLPCSHGSVLGGDGGGGLPPAAPAGPEPWPWGRRVRRGMPAQTQFSDGSCMTTGASLRTASS